MSWFRRRQQPPSAGPSDPKARAAPPPRVGPPVPGTPPAAVRWERMEGTALDVTDGPGGEQVTVRLEPRTAEAYTAVVYLAVDNDDDDLLRLPVEGEVRSYEVDPASGTVRFDRSDARNVTGA